MTRGTFHGLSQSEVEERVKANNLNYQSAAATESTKDIIFKYTFNLFNLLNLFLAMCLASVGAFKNMFFILIILLNVAIGIIQEIRARNLVKNLTLLSPDKVTVIRSGEQLQIDSTQLVIDEVVVLSMGEQVPADLRILEGYVEANESLLTGESDNIPKHTNDILYSGSYIESGRIVGQIIHVGSDNYAAQIVEKAQVSKPIVSELLASIRKISQLTSYIIIPIGILFFIQIFVVQHHSLEDSIIAIVAALLGMLPKGLVLLISIALSSAVIKLAQKRVLVQNMYAIETFARMDLICLDKTGTITEGKIALEEAYIMATNFADNADALMASYLSHTPDANATIKALRQRYHDSPQYNAVKVMPFSSARKWGAVELSGVGTLYLGAPEKLLNNKMIDVVREEQQRGRRVIVMAIASKTALTEQPTNLQLIAYFSLSDPIREEARSTLAYLTSQSVHQKIISGDNPSTVAHIAREVGFLNADKYIDLSTCLTDAEVVQAATQYDIFGRVTPNQKRLLVKAFKEEGYTVGMTGDGVNDILAMREADVSIAMGEGDSATRQVSDIVLLDSDFSVLPFINSEGRRVVNNVSRSASVFFIKTIYSLIIALLCIMTGMTFPFIPIQITLIDLIVEGYASLILSFEENSRPVISHFLQQAFRKALPYALVISVNIIVGQILHHEGLLNEPQAYSFMFYMLIVMSILSVMNLCIPFNRLRLFVLLTMTMGMVATLILLSNQLMLAPLTGSLLISFIVSVVSSVLILLPLRAIINHTLHQWQLNREYVA